MRRLVLARARQALLVAASVAFLAFVLLQLAPGDPIADALDDPSITPAIREQLRAQYGLGHSFLDRITNWTAALAHGDLGWSVSVHAPVRDVVAAALPNTLLLMGCALALGFAGGLAVGTWQASRVGSAPERVVNGALVVVTSVPEFLWSLGAVALFALRWRLLPSGGMVDDAMHDALGWPGRLVDIVRHLILPVSALALVTAAVVARHHRAAMLDVLPRAFVRTVRAKGVSETQVILAHVLPNALGPALVLMGLQLPALVGGAVIVETIFSWPGMGRVLVGAVTARDPFLVVAIVLVTSLVVTLGGLLTDLGAAALDPRRRAELR